ncbi:MAG: hypothetical protein R2822_24785 [Spirosomataceae bacterium]
MPIVVGIAVKNHHGEIQLLNGNQNRYFVDLLLAPGMERSRQTNG